MAQTLFPLFVIIIAGCAAAVQAPMNAALGAGLGSGTAAAAISFGIGFLALLSVVFFNGDAEHLTRIGSVNRWLLVGGFMGAFYVWAILWAIPALGVVTAISAMIMGQLIVALFLDAFGPLGLPVTAITPQRIFAILLVAAGLVLSKV